MSQQAAAHRKPCFLCGVMCFFSRNSTSCWIACVFRLQISFARPSQVWFLASEEPSERRVPSATACFTFGRHVIHRAGMAKEERSQNLLAVKGKTFITINWFDQLKLPLQKEECGRELCVVLECCKKQASKLQQTNIPVPICYVAHNVEPETSSSYL